MDGEKNEKIMTHYCVLKIIKINNLSSLDEYDKILTHLFEYFEVLFNLYRLIYVNKLSILFNHIIKIF